MYLYYTNALVLMYLHTIYICIFFLVKIVLAVCEENTTFLLQRYKNNTKKISRRRNTTSSDRIRFEVK